MVSRYENVLISYRLERGYRMPYRYCPSSPTCNDRHTLQGDPILPGEVIRVLDIVPSERYGILIGTRVIVLASGKRLAGMDARSIRRD